MSISKIVISGQVVKAPEKRFTPNTNVAVTEFFIAVNPTPRQGQPNETALVKVITWRDLAERCSTELQKGDTVAVDGRLQINTFTTAEGMVGSFGEGIAWVHNKRILGKEFMLPQGQLLSIKTNRMIDLSKMEKPPASIQANQQNMAPRTPGLAGHDPDFHYYAGPNQNQMPANQAPMQSPPPDNSIFDAPINGGNQGMNSNNGPGPDDPF